MSAKFSVTSMSQSGWIAISFKGNTRHIGSWMLRITKQANEKSVFYMTISIWPRDKKFNEAFVPLLRRLGKRLNVEDFEVKPARMLDQEYEITCKVATALGGMVTVNLMTRLCKMRIFSSLKPE